MGEIILGDCLEVMRGMGENSVDSIVTDPPYGLAFMGKKWDYDIPSVDVWREVLRVLKPGGHLLSFGGTRTYHRLVVAIEDAGFEIRDQVQWLYGSGFPKSLDVSKAIDKAAGAEREVLGVSTSARPNHASDNENIVARGQFNSTPMLTAPSTAEAVRWQGWGTALKPANEPIVLARKPLSEKTVAENVQKWGTGGINIDGCRVETSDKDLKGMLRTQGTNIKGQAFVSAGRGEDWTPEYTPPPPSPLGRFPANLLLSCSCEGDQHDLEVHAHLASCAVGELDRQSGILKQGVAGKKSRPFGDGNIFGTAQEFKPNGTETYACNKPSGASRFFYVAKASKRERNEGLDAPSSHPTVKPITLMRYLCRLITPPNGLVLDPFAGSGSTGVAALKEGFQFVGIEREAEYVEIARKRILTGGKFDYSL